MAKTNQQIIVTEGDFGVEILTQFIDTNKKPVPIEGCSCKIKFAYDGNVITEKTGIVIDEPKGIVSVVLDKEETQYSGLWTSYWICYDQFNNVTTTENIYYYVQPAIGSINNPVFTELLNYFNRDEVNDMFKSILEQLNNYTLSKEDVEEYIKTYIQDKVDDDFVRQCILDAIGNGSDYAKKQDVTTVSNNLHALSQRVDRYNKSLEQEDINLSNNIQAINSKLDTIKSLNINIGDYEIDNTGTTDVTLKIQEIFNYVRDNGGGKITFPTGEYYIRNYIDVYSNTYVFFEDGCVITKKGGLGSQTTFAINRIADGQPYGYTAKNITFDGGVFNGCKLGLGIVVQKVKNLTFKNMKFIDCMIDSHIMDLQAVNNCLVENCVFEGRYPSSPDRIHAECIQYDITSKPGAPSFSGADGTKSYGVIVRNCTFKPNDNDETSTGFTMFGTHSSWNCYHEAIIIENNTVIDTEYRMIHMPNASNMQIRGNTFINKKGNNVGAILLDTLSVVHDVNSAHQSSATQTTDGKKFPSKTIIIDNNVFEGFIYNSSDNPIVSIKGLDGYRIKDVNITNNTFINCNDVNNNSINGQDCIGLLHCDNVNISNNILNDVRRLVYTSHCSNISIINNSVNKIKSNGMSINTTDYLTISNNIIKDSTQSAIYATNCRYANINCNTLFENGLDGTNPIIGLGSCVDTFTNNNLIINTNTIGLYGINIFKTSASPAYIPSDNFTSNNVYKGVTYTENFSKDTVGDKSKSGIMINGYQLLTTSKKDKTISVTNVSIKDEE